MLYRPGDPRQLETRFNDATYYRDRALCWTAGHWRRRSDDGGPRACHAPARPPGPHHRGRGRGCDARRRNGVCPNSAPVGPLIDVVNRELATRQVSPEFEQLVMTDRSRRSISALAGVDVLIVHNVHTLHKNLAFTEALYRRSVAGRAPRTLAWCHDFAWSDPLYAAEVHPGAPWDHLRTAWPDVRYVVVSEDRREILADLLGLPADQITVVTPGVNPAVLFKLEPEIVELVERFDLLDADPLLLLPARITRRKNIELAIAIVGAMRQQGARPRLIVTGPPGPHNPTNSAYLAILEAGRAASGADDAVSISVSCVDAQRCPAPRK